VYPHLIGASVPTQVHIPNRFSVGSAVFGRPFVEPFALCYQTVVCLSCPVCLSVLSVLSVTLVYCGQTVGPIQMKLGTQVGLGPGHIVLDGNPGPPPPKGHGPQFSAHICCGQMARWIKMPLRRKLGLDPSDIVSDRAVASGVLGGAQHPREAGAAPVLRMARSTPS